MDSGIPSNQRGQLKSVTDPGGNGVTVTARTADGKPAEVQRTTGSGKLGFPLQEMRTMSMGGGMTVTQETNTLEFSMAKLEDFSKISAQIITPLLISSEVSPASMNTRPRTRPLQWQ